MVWRRRMVGVANGRNIPIGTTVLTILAYLASPTFSAATPVAYVLNPPIRDASDTITVTGNFTFDASGPTLDSVDLVATGGPQPGSYTVPLSATASQILAEIPSTDSMIRIGFTADLGERAVMVSFVSFPPAAIDPLPVTGIAVPEGIPEPGTIALVGAILGVFLVASRANRGRHLEPPPASSSRDKTGSGNRKQKVHHAVKLSV